MPKGQKKRVVWENLSSYRCFKNQPLQALDALQEKMTSTEHKPIVLGTIYPKYISTPRKENRAHLEVGLDHGVDPKDFNEHRARKVSEVSREGLWALIHAHPKPSKIGQITSQAKTPIKRTILPLRSTFKRLLLSGHSAHQYEFPPLFPAKIKRNILGRLPLGAS